MWGDLPNPAVSRFIELCAGTASLSLRLHRADAHPAISRMGAKTGYAEAILGVLGLNPGDRAAEYVWCEPDAGVRMLLGSYSQPKDEIVAALQAWLDVPPRELWSQLKAEGPPKDPSPREIARVARILTSNRLINLDTHTWKNSGKGGSTFGGADFCTPLEGLIRSFREAPSDMVVQVESDARRLPVERGEGAIVYIDPPYVGTTGYASDLPREDVVALARRWADAGATVCISEAEAIPELLMDGWFQVEITGSKQGMPRTFSKQQREFLTLNREPDRYWAARCAREIQPQGEGLWNFDW